MGIHGIRAQGELQGRLETDWCTVPYTRASLNPSERYANVPAVFTRSVLRPSVMVAHAKKCSENIFSNKTLRWCIWLVSPTKPGKHKTLHTICTTAAQRLRRWPTIVEMLCKCFVFVGKSEHSVASSALHRVVPKVPPHYDGVGLHAFLVSTLKALKYLCTNHGDQRVCRPL